MKVNITLLEDNFHTSCGREFKGQTHYILKSTRQYLRKPCGDSNVMGGRRQTPDGRRLRLHHWAPTAAMKTVIRPHTTHLLVSIIASQFASFDDTAHDWQSNEATLYFRCQPCNVWPGARARINCSLPVVRLHSAAAPSKTQERLRHFRPLFYRV